MLYLKANGFVFLEEQLLFLCVWWNRYPCWRREIVLKCEFLSYPLNSFWDVLVISVNWENPPKWNPLFSEVSKCYISWRNYFRVLGLDVADGITSVHFLLFMKEELTRVVVVVFLNEITKESWYNNTCVNFSHFNGDFESWALLFSWI